MTITCNIWQTLTPIGLSQINTINLWPALNLAVEVKKGAKKRLKILQEVEVDWVLQERREVREEKLARQEKKAWEVRVRQPRRLSLPRDIWGGSMRLRLPLRWTQITKFQKATPRRCGKILSQTFWAQKVAGKRLRKTRLAGDKIAKLSQWPSIWIENLHNWSVQASPNTVSMKTLAV